MTNSVPDLFCWAPLCQFYSISIYWALTMCRALFNLLGCAVSQTQIFHSKLGSQINCQLNYTHLYQTSLSIIERSKAIWFLHHVRNGGMSQHPFKTALRKMMRKSSLASLGMMKTHLESFAISRRELYPIFHFHHELKRKQKSLWSNYTKKNTLKQK